MPLSLPDPRQFRSLAAGGVRTTRDLLALGPRIQTALQTFEELLERLTVLLDRLADIEHQARAVLERVNHVQDQAKDLITETSVLGARVATVADDWSPVLAKVLPTVSNFSETWGAAEVSALAALVRVGPPVVERLGSELIPAVDTLKTVAPDLAELVTASKTLNEIIGAVPGLGRAKKRAQEEA